MCLHDRVGVALQGYNPGVEFDTLSSGNRKHFFQ